MSSKSTSSTTKKLPLPDFLKMLTAGSSLSMKEAINVAGKLYGQYNTPQQLRELSTPKLEVLRFSPDERKNIMAALKYAGHVELPKATSSQLGNAKKSVKRKRAPRDAEPDLSAPTEVAAEYQPMPILDLHLDEITDEEAIKKEVVVCNRAPVMKAWAMVVCECLGFKRAEALSISAAYTEMNAISKGVSVGVMNKARGEHIELEQDDAQPYVDLMGRRIALMKSRDGTYRALVKGEPVDPTHAHSYIKRAFKQSSPRVFGAMRMLASSFAPNDLNTRGYGMYADFRPTSGEWGSRSEMRLCNILDLRRQAFDDMATLVKEPPLQSPQPATFETESDGEPAAKRQRLAGSEPLS